MTFPPVSIVIPTRDRAEKLPRLVTQLENQDYPHDSFEVIIVDNGSNDNTADKVNQIKADSGLRIKYVYEPRLGVTNARNRGAAEADYDFVAYIDDDCSVRSDWLRQLMSGFNLHPDVAAVGGLVNVEWDKKRPRWLSPQLESYLGATAFLGNQARVLENNERIVEFNLAIRQADWKDGGGFQGLEQLTGQHVTAGEIHPLLIELRKQGRKIAFIPAAVVEHQVSRRATVRWFLWRGYWQGITDAIFAHNYYKQSRQPVIFLLLVSLRGAFIEFVKAVNAFIKGDVPNAMTSLINTLAYLGRMVGDLRIATGGFKIIHEYVTTN